MTDTAATQTGTDSATANWWVANMAVQGHRVEPDTDQIRCLDMLAKCCGQLYNLGTLGPQIPTGIKLIPHGISVVLSSQLSSYDSDHLTRLVVEGHERCIRVEVGPWHDHLDEDRATSIREWKREHDGLEYVVSVGEDGEEIVPMPLEDIALVGMELRLQARDVDGTHQFSRHPRMRDVIRDWNVEVWR